MKAFRRQKTFSSPPPFIRIFGAFLPTDQTPQETLVVFQEGNPKNFWLFNVFQDTQGVS